MSVATKRPRLHRCRTTTNSSVCRAAGIAAAVTGIPLSSRIRGPFGFIDFLSGCEWPSYCYQAMDGIPERRGNRTVPTRHGRERELDDWTSPC
jgi:hypothetical protein